MKQNQYKTKSQMIYVHVQKDIITGKFKPGTRLFVSDIAKTYGVSEIPVREAFQTLVRNGFLDTQPNLGYIVSPLTKKDVREIFELRIELESLAARLAARYITQKDLALLYELVEQSQVCVESGDTETYWRLNRKWHYELYKIARNNRLLKEIKALYSYSRRYPTYFTGTEQISRSLTDHLLILDAYREKETKLVYVLVKTHTERSYRRVLQRLEETLQDK